MTPLSRVLTVALCALGTMLTRFLPFLLFSPSHPTPRFVLYLGRALPGAVFGMLLVYCLKDVSLLSGSHGVPEFLSIAVTVIAHLYKRSMLLSIAVGTVCYMMLTRFVF